MFVFAALPNHCSADNKWSTKEYGAMGGEMGTFFCFFFDDAHVLELASGVDVCESPKCFFLEGRTMLTRKQSFRLDGNRALFVRDIFIYNIYVV